MAAASNCIQPNIYAVMSKYYAYATTNWFFENCMIPPWLSWFRDRACFMSSWPCHHVLMLNNICHRYLIAPIMKLGRVCCSEEYNSSQHSSISLRIFFQNIRVRVVFLLLLSGLEPVLSVDLPVVFGWHRIYGDRNRVSGSLRHSIAWPLGQLPMSTGFRCHLFWSVRNEKIYK